MSNPKRLEQSARTSGAGGQSAKLATQMPIGKLSHSKICFSRLNQRRITVAKKKYSERPARAGCPVEIAFQSLGLWTCKEVITFRGDSAGPAIRIYVFFICNIPFSRFINGKCFVGHCGRLSPSILKKPFYNTLCIVDCHLSDIIRIKYVQYHFEFDFKIKFFFLLQNDIL